MILTTVNYCPEYVCSLFHHPDLLLSPSKGKVEPDVTWRRSDQSNGGRNSQLTQTSQSNAHKRSPYLVNDQSSGTGSSADASSSGTGSWRCVFRVGSTAFKAGRERECERFAFWCAGVHLHLSASRRCLRADSRGRAPVGETAPAPWRPWWGPWLSWRRPEPRRPGPRVSPTFSQLHRDPQGSATFTTQRGIFSLSPVE